MIEKQAADSAWPDRRITAVSRSGAGYRRKVQALFKNVFQSLFLTPLVDDDVDEIHRFQLRVNERFLRGSAPGRPTYSYSRIVKSIEGRNAVMREIDGHPDLHDYLWFRAGSDIPAACRWVIRATATFAHPVTNVIFATATGTHDVFIRVPLSQLEAVSDLTSAVDAGSGACVWVKSRLDAEQDRRLLAVAHAAARRPA